jgi:hypothetical protein
MGLKRKGWMETGLDWPTFGSLKNNHTHKSASLFPKLGKVLTADS